MTEIFNRKSEKGKRRELRSEMPPVEAILWTRLQNRQLLDCKFRRQYGVGPYVLDFYSPEIKLGIELDGESHFLPGAPEADLKRQKYIETFGIKLVRFENPELYDNVDAVLEQLASEITARRQERIVAAGEEGSSAS